jgi:hypothetical protein
VETVVFSRSRRARVIVRQHLWGQSPAPLTPDRFLSEQEVRRLALAYLSRVEPHADACSGSAPPATPVAETRACQPATLVAEPVLARGNGQDPYEVRTVEAHVDPGRTRWIAWNDQPRVTLTSPSRPGQHLLGPGGFGVDDSIDLTVSAPDGRSATVTLDANDMMGVSSGPQGVILGRRGVAPPVLRRAPGGQERIFDEEGALGQIFARPGTYTFTFAFRDNTRGRGGHGHGRLWLLIDTADCPVPVGAVVAASDAGGGAPPAVLPPPGPPQALGLPVRLYLWESIHSNQPAYEHEGRFWFFSQEQWTGFLVQRGRDFERYQAQEPGRAVRRYTYQGRFRIVWP